MPIHITPDEMKSLIGVECSIVILYGKTEEEITGMLEPLITPDTNIIE
jgi:hypothetical protein